MRFIEEQNTLKLKYNKNHIKIKIHLTINIQDCNIIRENLLFITIFDILYIDSANSCYLGYSRQSNNILSILWLYFKL